MPRVFLGNFDFEHELSGRLALSPVARQVATDLSAAWLTLADPGDVILVEPGAASGTVGGVEFVSDARSVAGPAFAFIPWGWTERTVAMAKQFRWQFSAPPLDIVRRVNHRQFRFALEQELGIAPEGSALISSLEAAEAIVGGLPVDPELAWVMKAGFGMAGREQWRAEGPLDAPARRWILQNLNRTGPIVFEPWLDSIREAGLLFDVPTAGPPRCLGTMPQSVDSFGAYRGNTFGAPEDHEDWAPAIESGLEVARRLQAEGYFGPLSLDAMRYRDGQHLRLRPLQDLNARWSMGRLALALAERLPDGQCGAWLHIAWRGYRSDFEKWLAHQRTSLPPTVQVEPLAAPESSHPLTAPRRLTLVVTARDPADRKKAESLLRPFA